MTGKKGRPKLVKESLDLGSMGLRPVNRMGSPESEPLTVPYGVRQQYMGVTRMDMQREMAEALQARIGDIATGRVFIDRTGTIGSTSPILGQYAARQSYPDDWGFYWEYLYSRFYVEEVSQALRIKTNLVWNNGWEIEASSQKLEEKFEKKFKKMRLDRTFKNGTNDLFTIGNYYGNLVTDGEYKWDERTQEFTEVTPTEKLYGVKHLDARTMRRIVNPIDFDPSIQDLQVIRFVQRLYVSGLPSIPRLELLQKFRGEASIHPKHMVHMRVNRVYGSTYGYSFLREALITLKGYLIMYQFLPLIFQKRADPLLHVKFGGTVDDGNGKVTVMPKNLGDIEQQKSVIENRSPGEDIYTDPLTEIKEIYQANNSVRGLDRFLEIWRERVYGSLNIPVPRIRPNMLETSALMNEIRDVQEEVEYAINTQVMPLLTAKEVEFHFNELEPEDWMAKVRACVQLAQIGWLNREYGLTMLHLPPQAGEGAVPFTQWGLNPTFGTPAGGFPQGNPNKMDRRKSAKAKKKPNYTGLSKPKEDLEDEEDAEEGLKLEDGEPVDD